MNLEILRYSLDGRDDGREATEGNEERLRQLLLECESSGRELPVDTRDHIGNIGRTISALQSAVYMLAKRVSELEMALAARDIAGK